MDQGVEEGIRLFNSGKFFEAHEALEAVWLKSVGEDKLFLHGLIQVAAAFHHLTRENRAGFRSLIEKGTQKLDRVAPVFMGIDVARLRRSLHPWRVLPQSGGEREARSRKLPRIHRTVSRKTSR